MSSPQNPLDRELGLATDKLSLTSSQAAAHAVLFTNELLCNIIGRLPLRDIVSATGTCKFWREAMKGDQHIQEALFLKPAAVREVFCENWRINDLAQPISIDDCLVVGEVHPHLDVHFKCVVVGYRIRHAKLFPTTDSIEHPNGTWRDMFLTQPPCKRVRVSISGEHQIMARDTGVTFGELYDLIHSNSSDHEGQSRSLVTICDYVDEEDMSCDKPFTTRCQVRDSKACRPKELPLRTAYSDTDDSDDEYWHYGGFGYFDSDDEDWHGADYW